MERTRERGSQTLKTFNLSTETKDKETQIGGHSGSYNRSEKERHHINFRKLLRDVICNKDTAIRWSFENNVIARSRQCPVCGSTMELKKAPLYSSDGFKWRCQKSDHIKDISMRKGSWFEKSNLTIEEIIELTYWWTTGTEQKQIIREMGISSRTAVDWDNFCREVCDEIMMNSSSPISGPGVRVQIDESKFGKIKYHRGHHVDGQWVFGGIEEKTRKNFMIAVDKRDRNTLLPIIEQYILPGSIIISDCWKAYDILGEKDYLHFKVNHSIEFVNSEGDHTNKIEGHWRQAKSKMPSFGVTKAHFKSHLGEFMWRYMNKDKDLFTDFVQCITKIYDTSLY